MVAGIVIEYGSQPIVVRPLPVQQTA